MKLSSLLISVLMITTSSVWATSPAHSAKGVKAKQEQTQPPKAFDSPQAEGTAATCPVTGEPFKITKDTKSSKVQGKWVYYCCPGCKETFEKDPAHYLPGTTEK